LVQVGKGNTSVVVKVNDRPNCSRHADLIDLTTTAFRSIGNISSGRLQGTLNILGSVSKDYTKKMIPSDTFSDLGITLDANIPNTYLINETLHITGKELL
jgi:rare lipoprotein A (peptidoglycan hydrolase)